MSEQTYLCAQGITKSYHDSSANLGALRGIDIVADAGEFVAIRGPSGYGKSTLLHILGAMDRPSEGTVWLNGRRLDTLRADQLAEVRRRHIGFIFQAFNLLPTTYALQMIAIVVAGREDHAIERSV